MAGWIYASLTTGVSTQTGLPASRKYMIIHNPSKTNYVAFTFDGTNPVIEGAGITLFPGGTTTSDQFTMNGTMKTISDGTSKLTIYYR